MTWRSLCPLPPRTQITLRSRSRSHTFRHPQSCSVQGGQNRPVAEVLRIYEQRFDLFLAQNDGQLLLIPRQRNPLDIDLAVQGIAIEKTETADGLNVRRELDSFFVKQI